MLNKKISDLVKSRIKKKAPNAEIILYGSRARGDAKANSDWDIIILLDVPHLDRVTEMEFKDEIYEIELETGEAISTSVYSKNDWAGKYSITPFYHNIKAYGKHL